MVDLKAPPSSQVAEQTLIGCLIMDNDQVDEVRPVVTSRMFYGPINGLLYKVICDMRDERERVDFVSLTDRIEASEQLIREWGLKSDILWASLIATTTEGVSTPRAAVQYAKIVQKKYMYRQIIATSNELREKAYVQEADPVEIVAALSSFYENMVEDSIDEYGSIKNFQESIEWYESEDLPMGCSFGFEELDYDTLGGQPGDLIILMGRPETFKTWLAFYVAVTNYVANKNVLVIEIEMGRKKSKHRMESFLSRINSRKIRDKTLDEDELGAYKSIQDIVDRRENDIFIITRKESPTCTPSVVMGKIKKFKPDLVIVDSVLSMDAEVTVRDERQRVVRNVRSLKKIAEATQVPILAVHHTTRDKDTRIGKPSKNVAAESDVIAQDSDLILHIQVNEDLANRNMLFMGMAKNRDNEKKDYLLRADMSVPEFYIERAGTNVLENLDQPERPEWMP